MSTSIRIFRYIPDDDAFLVTDEYRRIAETLNLAEWHPAVWIGRLFTLDNDLGEHWFDNWELRADRGLSDDYLIIDPDRFQDGRDGPCNTPEFRKRFWTDVLKSLELSLELLFDKALQFNEKNRQYLEKYPDDHDAIDDVISDLENRIAIIKLQYGVVDE
jgi:hypothetical protein